MQLELLHNRGMNIKLLESFPQGFKPNVPQDIIFNGIAEAMEQGKKYIIINAPTGSGKSFISKTLANFSRKCTEEYSKILHDSIRWGNVSLGSDDSFGAAILTCTKSLQDQYADLFEDGRVLKGKINYNCGKDNNVPCDTAECCLNDKKKDKCWKDNICPYYEARYEAAVNRCSFYNYSMFLSLPEPVKYKQFLVCDEASELEDVLVTEYTLDIDLVQLNKEMNGMMPPSPDEGSRKHAYFEWLRSLQNAIRIRMNEFSSSADGKKRKMNKTEAVAFRYLTNAMTSVAKMLDVWDESDWFRLHKEDGHLVFVPYEVDKLAKHFFDYGETVILMSATIVNPKKYAKMLGIDDYYFIDAPSTMDAGRGFITAVNPDFRPNYKNKDTMIPLMSKTAKAICEQFPDKKGIIHTNSFEIQKLLQKELGWGGRFLYRQAGLSNEQMIETHKATSTPTVLVSPSMTHGVDLKGKLGEFQIIMKAPFPNLGDPRIKRKAREDSEWYTDKMLSTLIQACGRCNRSADDLAITFILDFNAYEALVKNKAKLPAYFNARLTEEAKESFKKACENS